MLLFPNTLSLRSIFCFASGVRLAELFVLARNSSFRPISRNVRFAADISKSLPGGPSACEHSDEFWIRTSVDVSGAVAVVAKKKCELASRLPKGFAPLQVFCARPSQKLLLLKTAFTALGVLRGSTRRVLIVFAGLAGSG